MRLPCGRYALFYQYGLLLVLILLGVSMGFWNEILIPTLSSLSQRLNVSYESMGYALSIRSIGNVFALMLVAVIYDSYSFIVPYFMVVECLIGGVCTIIIPWCRNYWVVVVFFFVQSGCQNALNNGCQLTILQVFREKSIGKMQLFHLGYGIGGVFSGLISQVFLNQNKFENVKLTKFCLKSQRMPPAVNLSLAVNLTKTPHINPGFEYIYLVSGIFAICTALIFLAYRLVPHPIKVVTKVMKGASWLKKIDPRYVANGDIIYGISMSCLLFLYYFFYIFGLVSFIPFVVVYATDPCKGYAMSLRAATYLHTALNGCFLLGRVIGSFLLDKKPTFALLCINTLNILFNLVLILFSHKYALALWIGACGMRMCNSIVYPSGTSYLNRYIVVTSSLISLAFLGDTVGSFAGSSLGGYLIDNYPSNYITYSCCFGMSCLMCTVTVLVILTSRRGRRDFSKQFPTNPDESEL